MWLLGIIIIILTSAIVFLIIRIQQLEKQLNSTTPKHKKSEGLSSDNDVIDMALNIIEKNQILKSIGKKLARLSSNPELSGHQREIIEIREEVLTALQMDKQRDTFELFVEEQNRAFYKRLDKKFPKLTRSERRLAALLRLNLSSKEIASLLNISPKSVEMNRYRLRKKIQIGKNTNLSEFIRRI